MNKLQTKLTQEIAKQEAKGRADHQVAGYRQTDNARSLLETARAKQVYAIQWRKRAIATGADSVRIVIVSNRHMSVNVSVFSKDGDDVLALAPSRKGFWTWTSDERRNLVDHYTSLYLKIRLKKA